MKCALTLASLALAATPAVAAEPSAGGIASPTIEPLLRMTLALVVLAGVTWGIGILARRRRLARGITDARIDVLAMRALGPRHRVALLAVGERRLLVGLGPESLQTLADLSESLSFESELAAQGENEPEPKTHTAVGRFEGLDG